jgi:hypothetical protein
MTRLHIDPSAAGFADDLEIEEKPLDWILEQLDEAQRPLLLGDVTAVDLGAAWGFAIERRQGLHPRTIQVFDTWARIRVQRLLETKDPSVDGWHHYDTDEDGDPINAWHLVCLTTDDMPDMSWLDGL